MEIDGFKIDVRRHGEKTRLTLQGGSYGVGLNMSLPELEPLSLFLASERGKWRDELVETETNTLS